MRHRRMTDEDCSLAVYDVLSDGEHHTFPDILARAEFVEQGEGEEWYEDDLGPRQVRRGLSVLQDTSEDAIYSTFVCHEDRHDCFGQWVYQLSTDPDIGEMYMARRLRKAAKEGRASVKCIRQTSPFSADEIDAHNLRQAERHIARGLSYLLPVITSQAARQGATDAAIERLMDRYALD